MAIAKVLLDVAVNELNQEKDPLTGPLSKESSTPALVEYTTQHPTDMRARLIHVKRLGRGGQGDVSKVEEISSGKQFALKAMRFTHWDDPVRDDEERERREALVRDEVEIMQNLRHLHIATVLFTVRERESFDFIMLPVADKDLHTFFEECSTRHYLGTKRELLPKWMGCLVSALAFAHEQQIRHKDIKPKNILVKGDQVYLTDFGIAVDFSTADVSYTEGDFQGTRRYQAPENTRGMSHGRAADMFSLGCVFSEMLTIFKHKSIGDFVQKRRKSYFSEDAYHLTLPAVKRWLLELRGDELSDFLVDSILNMLQSEPRLRYKAVELKKVYGERDAFGCEVCRMGD